jgi:fumarate reductase flavoprotein subunit
VQQDSDDGRVDGPKAGPVDVVVIGGGLAGWMAATAAREAGASVAVVERAARRPGWGNSVVSGGALHAAMSDPRTAPADLARLISERTDGHADPAVLDAWANNAARTIEWIEAHGGELMTEPGQPYRAKVFAPVRVTEPGMRWAGFGTAEFLVRLRAAHEGAGGLIVQPARARALIADDVGWSIGLSGGVLRARCVVLADGGFQANPSLMRTYVGTDRVKVRGASTSTGDGLRMGLANGGVAVNMKGFYGHLLAREALRRDDLWPYPILDLLAAVGIVVTSGGVRLVDENIGGVTTTNEVAWSDDPLGCWLIVDDDGWSTEGTIGVTPPNPWLLEHGATVNQADTLAELAVACGIDRSQLVATADAVIAGSPGPPRTGTVKLARAPFRAIPLVAGVTFTLGGLRVDGFARVLDAHGAPIPGLYAAGGTMGGLHGGPRAGYAGGLLEAAVFGLLAGEHAGTHGRPGLTDQAAAAGP